MKITIDENRRVLPKTVILGICGEIAARTLTIEAAEVDGAALYVMRFAVPSGVVYETEISGGSVTVPAAVLAETGCGLMQWVARSSTGQLIAKSETVGYAVMQSVGDETSTLPAPEDTQSAIDRIKEAADEAIGSISGLVPEDGSIQEVIDARTGCFSDYTFSSLNQRLNAEFSACVRQNTYERNMASLAAKDSELAANYETLLREIVPARTDYDGQTWGSLGSRLGADFFAVWTSLDKRTNQMNSLEARTLTTLGTPLKKNLLPYPASVAKGGITFTFDSNGYMTASETSADGRQWTAAGSQYSVKLRAGTYILSFVSSTACTNAYGNIMVLDADSTKIADIGQKNYAKYQSGSVEFTLDTDQTVYVMAKIFDGTTGIMLRHADITDGAYEPYTKSIQEQLDELKAQIAAMTTAAATTETEE